VYCRQSGSSVAANAVEQSSSTTNYSYSALQGTPAETTAGHGIDSLYAADVYERLVAVSATPTLRMSSSAVSNIVAHNDLAAWDYGQVTNKNCFVLWHFFLNTFRVSASTMCLF